MTNVVDTRAAETGYRGPKHNPSLINLPLIDKLIWFEARRSGFLDNWLLPNAGFSFARRNKSWRVELDSSPDSLKCRWSVMLRMIGEGIGDWRGGGGGGGVASDKRGVWSTSSLGTRLVVWCDKEKWGRGPCAVPFYVIICTTVACRKKIIENSDKCVTDHLNFFFFAESPPPPPRPTPQRLVPKPLKPTLHTSQRFSWKMAAIELATVCGEAKRRWAFQCKCDRSYHE